MSAYDNMTELYIVSPGQLDSATEYFCFSCGQLRLSFIADKSKCKNCGSKDVKHSKPGTLDKEVLKRHMHKI